MHCKERKLSWILEVINCEALHLRRCRLQWFGDLGGYHFVAGPKIVWFLKSLTPHDIFHWKSHKLHCFWPYAQFKDHAELLFRFTSWMYDVTITVAKF